MGPAFLGAFAGFLSFQVTGQAPPTPATPRANPFAAVHELLPARPVDFHEVDLTAVAAGDFDGDGDLDAALGMVSLGDWGDSPMRMTLLLHQGGGRFVDAGEGMPEVASFPQHIGVADVDQDGDVDLLVTNGGAGILDQLFVDAGRRFVDRSSQLELDHGRGTVRFGDVDGDGDADVLFPQPSSTWVPELHTNDGSGTFARTAAFFTASQLGDARLADVDADGDLDALFSRHARTSLWHNDGSGGFTDASAGRVPTNAGRPVFAVADLDGDSDPDLAGTGFTLRNDAGVFTSVAGAAIDGPLLELVDVDADGDRDLFGPRGLALNDGAGRLTPAPGRVPVEALAISAFAAGDFDADGDVDGLVAEQGEYLGPLPRRADYLLLNDGTGAFTDSRTFGEVPPSPSPFALVADLDGDELPDLLLLTAAGLELRPGDGSGAFGGARLLAAPGGDPADPTVADVDDDGTPDLLIASERGLELYLGPALTRTSTVLTTSLLGFALGDLDGDGDAEVVTREPARARLLLDQGGGVFAFAPTGSLPSLGGGATAVQLLDLERDGDLDLVFARGSVVLHTNDGLAHFTDVTAGLLPGVAAQHLACADVERDGDADLVTSTSAGQRLFVNDGTGSFSERLDGLDSSGGEWAGLLFLDGDADGDADLLGLGSGSWQVNDGGRFRRVARLANLGTATAADLDLDGDLDLVPGPSDWSGVLAGPLLRNHARQLAWRTLPSVGEPLEFVVSGPPREPFTLWFAPTRVVSRDAAGTLFLERSARSEIRRGTLDSTGRGSVTIPVPDDPALLGSIGYWQAAVGRVPRYTNHERTVLGGL